MRKRYILAVTGASGMLYAVHLLQGLCSAGEVHVVLSDAARQVLHAESDRDESVFTEMAEAVYGPDQIGAPPASGSWQHSGMIVCPCSMATLGSVATGAGDGLIHRAADVCLKEGRRLVLVTRETPLNQIHIANMLTASRAGAVIMPASPALYSRPETIEEMAKHFAGRVLDQLGLDWFWGERWGEDQGGKQG
jgi:4-hydroxy-3-polyprenylbenzoate decarboxylase